MLNTKSKFIKFSGLLVIICLLLAMVITSCASTPSGSTATQQVTPAKSTGPQYGGVLKVCTPEANEIGYPPLMLSGTNQKIAAPAIEKLLRVDAEGKYVPFLASGYKEDSSAKTITLTLNKGIKFHDGTDFNATAVKWNLDNCKSAKMAGTEMFASVDVVDDYTVRINLSAWDSTALGNLATGVGHMISPTAFNKNGKDWCINNPVGTGPFQFVSRQKTVNVVYKKFADYWQKGKPYLDGIEVIFVADITIQEMAFKAGEMDLNAGGLARKSLQTLEKEGFVVTRMKFASGADGLVPDSANANSPFANVKVRQAASYAIDAASIVKGILFGEAEVPIQWAYKGHWAYNPSVVGYPYNPTKAKQLLTEAGYPNGFKTKIGYYSDRERDDIFAAVQSYLKAVGIDTQLDPMANVKFKQVQAGQSWEGFLNGLAGSDPDTLSQIIKKFTGVGQYASMALPDDYMKAIKNGVMAPDFATKQKYMWEVEKLFIDTHCLYIPLYIFNDFNVGQKYLHDHGMQAAANASQWTPENAWMDKK